MRIDHYDPSKYYKNNIINKILLRAFILVHALWCNGLSECNYYTFFFKIITNYLTKISRINSLVFINSSTMLLMMTLALEWSFLVDKASSNDFIKRAERENITPGYDLI